MKMKKYPKSWTHDEFESLTWHDNYIHGIRIVNPHAGRDEYRYQLVLDIDFILEWIRGADGRYSFAVAPAHLTFDVAGPIQVNLDLAFKEDMIIDGIEREEVVTVAEKRVGFTKQRYSIHLHNSSGAKNVITFEGGGFVQELHGKARLQSGQWLETGKR
jgi:hypothetical protein